MVEAIFIPWIIAVLGCFYWICSPVEAQPVRSKSPGCSTSWESRISSVRRVLYMATLVATQRNSIIKRFYQHLLSKGKPKKVALVACMRKLLIILNEMVRHNELWREPCSS